jgi:hypothetical protein
MPSILAPPLPKDELIAALKRAAKIHGMHCRPIDHEGMRADLETTSARWLFGGRKVTYHFGCRLEEPSRTMRFREAVTEETWGIPAPLYYTEPTATADGGEAYVPAGLGPGSGGGPIEYHRIRHEIEHLVKQSGWTFSFERGHRP